MFTTQENALIKELGGLRTAKTYDGPDFQGHTAEQIRQLAEARSQAQREANRRSAARNGNGAIKSDDLLQRIMREPLEYCALLEEDGQIDLAVELENLEEEASHLLACERKLSRLQPWLERMNGEIDGLQAELLPVATRVRDALQERLEAKRRAEELARDTEKKQKIRQRAIKALMALGLTEEQAEAAAPE